MLNIRECPFCKNAPRIDECGHGDDACVWVECEHCNLPYYGDNNSSIMPMRGPYRKTKDAAIKAWNGERWGINMAISKYYIQFEFDMEGEAPKQHIWKSQEPEDIHIAEVDEVPISKLNPKYRKISWEPGPLAKELIAALQYFEDVYK